MKDAITLTTPESGERLLVVEPRDHALKLATWLERRGAPLNTRCGQMGLCRGCEIELEKNGATTTERACQLTVAQALDATRLNVPNNSWRDHSLSGVSAFELPPERVRIQTRPGIGLAVDVGTTTVAAALWDLQSGQCLAMASRANAQIAFGDNVLTRVNEACLRPDARSQLQSALVNDTISPLLDSLCASAGVPPESITEATAAGNTVMLHTLVGEDLAGFGRYPFKPVFIGEQCWRAKDLGWPLDVIVRTPDCLGPFVGADIVAGAMASGIIEDEGPALLIDFGTNGEIMLKHDGGYLVTATAVGPAFEGGRLSCGACAGPGVVSHVGWQNGKWELTVVDGERGPARAFSGAAYIDLIAILRTRGMLNEAGRFTPQASDVKERESGQGLERYIALTPRLILTEIDIAEIIQAKAAVMAGVIMLLNIAGLEPQDLKRIYVAGSFGYHLHLQHAVQIGLLPKLPLDRFSVIGNASLGGVSLMLLNGESPGSLRTQCRNIELNQCEDFEGCFIDCLALESL